MVKLDLHLLCQLNKFLSVPSIYVPKEILFISRNREPQHDSKVGAIYLSSSHPLLCTPLSPPNILLSLLPLVSVNGNPWHPTQTT